MLGAKPLEIFMSKPIDCREMLSLNIKMHLTLDRIAYLLYNIIKQKKWGGCSLNTPSTAPAGLIVSDVRFPLIFKQVGNVNCNYCCLLGPYDQSYMTGKYWY